MVKAERDFYLGKAHATVETFYQGEDKPYLLEALVDASRQNALAAKDNKQYERLRLAEILAERVHQYAGMTGVTLTTSLEQALEAFDAEYSK